MQTKTVYTEDLFYRKFCDVAVWLSTRSSERRKEIERTCRDLFKDDIEACGMIDFIFAAAEKISTK